MIDHVSVRVGVKKWRQVSLVTEGGECPASIPFLRGALSMASDPSEIDLLLSELTDEYIRVGMDAEVVSIQRERIERNPRMVVPWLSFADTLLRVKGSVSEARQMVARGVELAKQQDVLVRYALMCQARLAKEVGDGTLFSESLRLLIAEATRPRAEDCGLSLQLIDGVDSDFCPCDLLAAYREVAEDWSSEE